MNPDQMQALCTAVLADVGARELKINIDSALGGDERAGVVVALREWLEEDWPHRLAGVNARATDLLRRAQAAALERLAKAAFPGEPLVRRPLTALEAPPSPVVFDLIDLLLAELRVRCSPAARRELATTLLEELEDEAAQEEGNQATGQPGNEPESAIADRQSAAGPPSGLEQQQLEQDARERAASAPARVKANVGASGQVGGTVGRFGAPGQRVRLQDLHR